MRIITTHLSADLDAFAAAVCSVRLYPGYRVVFPGSLEVAVRRFLSETELPFPELKLREARRHRLEHAVVVDTRNPRRLGEVWNLIQASECPITLIDHHADEVEALGAEEVISSPVGATCTIIARMMRDQELPPTPEEASLLMMGIYEDTGGLSFRETTAEDLRMAAWLLESGASLHWVRRWVVKSLFPEQFDLLNRLLEETEEVEIHGIRVAIAMVEVDRYHEEAAHVVHRWVETFDIPVAVAMLIRPPNINVILRSRLQGLNLGRIAQRFGGGGHATAASARVLGTMPVELRESLIRCLDEEMPPPLLARDVAARQVFSVDAATTVAATKHRLNQLRVNALPVALGDDGPLVGTVTRLILDQALNMDLGERPVRSVMQPEVPTVAGDTTLEELRDLFLERSFRFVMVEDHGRTAGLITRMELFRRLFERQYAAGSSLDRRMAGARPVVQPITHLLRDVAPEWVQEVVAAARRVADARQVSVYLVGGLVRDLMLDRPNEDVDLVVEGEGIAFARGLAEELGGRCHPHQPFLTAAILLPDGHRLDVASARTEFYRTPAALPEVQTSLIRQDLYRRDFTINALAVALSGDRHGQLLDFFGGRRDLRRREIRVLHSLSFINDPTRAIRAVRYARRLGFTVAADTRHLIATAVDEGAFAGLTGQRLLRELKLLLAEPRPVESLAMLEELGLLAAVSPELLWSETIRAFLLEVEGELTWYELEQLGPLPEPWFLFLGGLVLSAGEGAAVFVAERLQLGGELRQRLETLPAAVERIRAAADPALSRSRRTRCVEEEPAEALLHAMAGLDMDSRRRLAEAAAVAARMHLPVRGRDLIRAGIPPGPHVGQALKRTRAALIDGALEPADSLRFALEVARCAAAETGDAGGSPP